MKFKTKIKTAIKLFLKKEYPFKVQVKIKSKWLGNEYGGFYVSPEFLNEKSVVYSFGIGEDISFDKELLSLYKCTVHGFDPTPKSITWVKNNSLPKNFFFHEYGIDSKNGTVTFYLPKNPDHVSGTVQKVNDSRSESITVPMKNLTTIAKESGHTYIDVLKMDIEGSEYSVIPDILSSGISIKQILIEFHHRFFDDGFKKNKETVDLLNSKGYKIFAVSDTNMEVSFIHSSLLNSSLHD